MGLCVDFIVLWLCVVVILLGGMIVVVLWEFECGGFWMVVDVVV